MATSSKNSFSHQHVTATCTTSIMLRVFPTIFGLSIVFLIFSTFTTGAGALTEAEGYCSYVTSNNASYQTSVSFSEMVRTSKGCGLWGWSSCTIYREVYKTRLETRYRLIYKKSTRCCDGWVAEESNLPLALPKCIRVVQPTTRPTVPPSNSSTIAGNIPTPELPSNYSVITTENTVILPGDVDTTDPGALPGGPVSNPGGGLFTGENQTRNLIVLIGVIVGLLLIIILVSVIAVCYRKKRRRKRHRKLSDSGVALELLNRGGASPSAPLTSNGRPGDSAYAEIPDGQTQTDATSATAFIETTDDSDENHNPPSAGPKGGNQYQEIADVLHQAEEAGVEMPSTSFTDSHLPDESHSGYAYAYIDGKNLPKDGEKDTNGNEDSVKLKGSAASKYAEVHKTKPSTHPKSPGSALEHKEGVVNVPLGRHEVIPTEIQAYITHVLPEADEDEKPSQRSNLQSKASEVPYNPEPYDEVKFDVVSPQPYDEVQFGLGMDPEPYDEVQFSLNMIPQSVEYDSVQRSNGKPGYSQTDNDDPQPYDELGPQPYGNKGPTSSSPDNIEYNKCQRSNSRQDTCNIDPSGYGVVVGDAQDSNTKHNNHYATLDGHSSNELAKCPSRPMQSKEYDRLDRQISTTSSNNGSPTKSRRNKISPTYSTLKRSTSRQDGAGTLPVGYGTLGDDGHGVAPEVYDKLNNASQLSAHVPVQDMYDVMTGPHSMDKEVKDSEGPYAIIPNDLSSGLPTDAYDDIQITNLHKDGSNGIQSNETKLSVYNTPGVPKSSTARQELNGYDTLYENTPTEKRVSNSSDSGLSGSCATYDTPSSRSSLTRQSSVGDPTDPTCDITTYDTPLSHSVPSRHSSFGNSTSETYDRPVSRNSNTNQPTIQNEQDDLSTYDSPRNSISHRGTLYENAAKRRNTVEGNNPLQYELMERQDSITSNASVGSYEDMQRGSRNFRAGSRGSRASLDIPVPSPLSKTPLTRKDTVYENTPRGEKKK